MFEAVARGVSDVVGIELTSVKKALEASYNEARMARRMAKLYRNPVEYSQELLATQLNVPVDEVKNGISRALLYIDSGLLFPDTIPAVEKLGKSNYVLGIVGNTLFWPSSYTRFILEKLGLARYLKLQVYADEDGVSKPDRRIFLRFCEKASVSPDEVLHVGDSIVEDVGGAISASMKVALVDRARRESEPLVLKRVGLAIIGSLEQIPQAVEMLTS